MINKNKIITYIIKTLITILILGIDLFLLIRFDYIKNLIYIDNLLGILPVFLILLFTVMGILLTWGKHQNNNKLRTFMMAGWMIASVALFPNSLTKNWLFGKEIKTIGSDGDITPYAPFIENTKAIKLDEPSTLTINENMPVLDGALALYPVYSAVAQNIYNKENYTDEVRFNNTIRGFNALIDGNADIFFGARPSDEQIKYAKANNKEIYLTPIGLEAFVFIVPKSNPINELSSQQIKNIYSGKTDYWRTLGYKDGGKIIKFQRPKSSGSQTMLEYIMGDLPIEKPQPAPNMDIIGTNELMSQMTVEYKGKQSALGYSFKFFSTIMNPNMDTKLLSIDGIAPTSSNISNKSYKYTNEFYAITIGEPKDNNKKVIDWILSNQGQELIERTGYSKL